jgi:hypothetical protein
MPKRRRTIPIASGQGPDPSVEINEKTWRQIEAALGEDIPLPVRSELIYATRRFLFWASYDEKALSTHKAKARISEIANVGNRLLEDHTTRSDIEARLYADMLINKHLIEIRTNETGTSSHLAEIGLSLVEACNRAIEELASERGFQSGRQWERWIGDLTTILQNNDLPTEVRKDSDKTVKVSPFVRFVKELQQAIPPEIRPKHSPFGLAEAITRARRVTIRRPTKAQKTRKAAT